jgi:hypothetical protein
LSATYTEILEDVLEISVGNHVDEFGSYDEETNRKLREQVLNENFAAEERERLSEEVRKIFGS